MRKDYKILIVGDIDSVYVQNFIKFLKVENPLANIYFWGKSPNTFNMEKSGISECLCDYQYYEIYRKYEKIPVLRFLEGIFRFRKLFYQFSKGIKFDVINIHFVAFTYLFLIDLLKKTSTHLILSPWGSDVYRIDGIEKKLLRLLFKKADYISGVNNRFTQDVMNIFHVPKSKIAFFDLGSATVDYILDNKAFLSTESAKHKMGIDNMYAITCAYNASPAQQHLHIIDAINIIRDKLPSKLILLFPFTYGGNKEYRELIKSRIDKLGLKALFVEDFLSIQNLFVLRQATDMFIHVQTTDANSTSLGEYLLCDKKVINGGWLRYKELEHGIYTPYFVVNNMENLGETILEAFHNENKIIDEKTLSVLKEKSCSVNAKRANSVFENIS